MAELPNYAVGDVLIKGDKIGRMGSTGKSSANHVHHDLVKGHIAYIYRLHEIMGFFSTVEEVDIIMQQYQYFIDEFLFGVEPVVTSSFGDPLYFNRGKWKFHPAYDLVPIDRHNTDKHFDFFWNRTPDGTVLALGFDDAYGNYINIGYEV